MMKIFYLLLFFSFVGFSQGTVLLYDVDVKAFPTAEGHGRFATGGRGQSIYIVNNLNNSGTGSFREAVSTGNRYIVFNVGGTITLTSSIDMGGDNITIAGETAPGDGIAIYGRTIETNTKQNIIVRNIRFRGGDNVGTDRDAVRIANWGTGAISKIIFDHCSFSWADDENISIENLGGAGGTMFDITIQRSIISQPLGSYASILWNSSGKSTYDVSYIGNLWSNNNARQPESTTPNTKFEFINNLVYGYITPARFAYGNELDWIGNTYITRTGQSQSFETLRLEVGTGDSGDLPNTKYYTTDNTYDGGTPTYGAAGATITDYLQGGRINSSGYIPLAESGLETNIKANVGARATMGGVDALDQEMIDDVTNDTGGFVTSELKPVDSPTLAAGTAYTDTDSDGLSDAYELDQGGSSTAVTQSVRPATAVIGDGRTIDQTNVTSYATTGYTHIEIFAADLAGDWDNFAPETVPATAIAWSNDTQSVSDIGALDLTLIWTPTNATDKGVTYSSTNTGVVNNSGVVVGVGTCTLTVTADDTTNGTLTDDMGVTIFASETPGLQIKNGGFYNINGGTYKLIIGQ